ncbi:MAG TPA: hypothetical protein VG797_09455 [Phycisphaerales bacterium]|nr:hypothetical protein [Phycisphaerales bacterium]
MPAPAQDEDSIPQITRDPREHDDVKVIFKDGRQIEGVYVAGTPTSVVVRVASVAVTLEREKIDRVVVLPPVLERYRQMRALVKDTDTERLLSLVEWAQRHELYEQAMNDVELVLRDEPNNGDGLRLKKLISEMIAMRSRAKPETGGPPPTDGERRRDELPRRLLPSEFPLLTAEQINLIKVYELNLSDLPRVAVPRETVEKLLAKYADNPLIPTTREGKAEFLAAPAKTILDVMFRVRAKELYPEIQVFDQPRNMEVFRDKVHAGWLINNCATSRCHGGPDAGRLMLMNRRPNAEASVYTNFLILERFKTAEGRPLINYDNPESSPLLQYGLPPSDAAFVHPRVKGWTPVFRSRDAKRFIESVDWIRMMYRPRPDYPIHYDPPGEPRGRGIQDGGEGVPR